MTCGLPEPLQILHGTKEGCYQRIQQQHFGKERFLLVPGLRRIQSNMGRGLGGGDGAAQIMAPGVCGKAVPSGQPGSRVRPAPGDLHGTSKLNLLKIL